MELDLGTRLNGRYSIRRIIGQGNMSYVYEAFDDLLQRSVAIKQMVIPHGAWDTGSFIKRFKREFHFLSAIEHPNVIKAHGFFAEANTAFMVLEIVKGPSLQEIIDKRIQNTLSLSMNLGIAIQLSRAIEVINTAGIIHRDIKPTNIIINDSNKKLKLLDLGVATTVKNELSRLTNHGNIVGTPDYLSPEQVGGEYSANSDVFSVAVVLYQIFSGANKSPFHNENPMSTMMSISTKELPPLVEVSYLTTDLYRETYKKIDIVLQKALAKEPEDRTASATTLADDFEMLYKEYRLNKTRVKEKKSQIVNWNVIEKANPEQVKKLKKLGDKFGRDEFPINKPLKTISSRRKSSRYPIKKKSRTIEMLIGFCFLLGIVLFMVMHFSKIKPRPQEKNRKLVQQNALFDKLLNQIKHLPTPEQWARLEDFNREYSIKRALVKKAQFERDILETLVNANSLINKRNTSSTAQFKKWNTIYLWKESLSFFELCLSKEKIKQQFQLFKKLFSSLENNKLNNYTLENKIDTEAYKKRHFENVRNALNSMKQLSSFQKQTIEQYYKQMNVLENIIRLFKKKMSSSKGKKIKLIVRNNVLSLLITKVQKNYIQVKRNSNLYNFYFYEIPDGEQSLDPRNFIYHIPARSVEEEYCYALLAYYGENYQTALKLLLKTISYGRSIYFLNEAYQKVYSQPMLKIAFKKPLKIAKNSSVVINNNSIKITGKVLINKHIANKKELIRNLRIKINNQKVQRKKYLFLSTVFLEYGKNTIEISLSTKQDSILNIPFSITRNLPQDNNFTNSNYFPSFKGKFKLLNWQNNFGKNLSHPIAYQDHIYIKNSKNTLFKISLDGESVWQKDNVYQITPTICKKTINSRKHSLYISSPNKVSYYEEKTMKLLWDVPLEEVIFPSILLRNYILFGTSTTLHAFSYVDQKRKWRKNIASTTKMIKANSKVYFATPNGEIASYNIRDGKKSNTYSTGSPILSAPTTSGHTIFVGNNQGNLYAFSNGKKRWEYFSSAAIHHSPAFAENHIYFVNKDYKLYCCDAQIGNTIWIYQADNEIVCQPLVTKDNVYITTKTGNIFAISKTTGKRTWQYSTQDSISNSGPTIHNNTMYIGDDGGNLYSLLFE
ncbi:PQQ-binding-like beta-propeller repeat protein [Candidatus Uabimicrobium sp. HlEnr_7]|uniref:serine/threonine-protein kinase n=1 Tax=Candidatus Uabimicrobium helgolandensis TaxID=3095367 RepID=UPI003558566A